MTPRRCKIRWCRQWFTPKSEDLVYCHRCRHELLGKERSLFDRTNSNAEALATTEYYSKYYREDDYRIINENGVEEWASEMIKRYKRQTRPRGV